MNDPSAEPMYRELCRRELVALLTQAEVDDHQPIIVSEPNVIIEILPSDPVEVLQSVPIELESVLVIPPQPERQGKRNVQRTSPLVSSQGNISRLVRNAEQKKEEQEQKRLAWKGDFRCASRNTTLKLRSWRICARKQIFFPLKVSQRQRALAESFKPQEKLRNESSTISAAT